MKELVAILSRSTVQRILHNWQLYALILIPLVYIIIFHYVPIYGLQMAFKNYNVVKGLSGSDWVGLQHYQRFFNSYDFKIILKNTVLISVVQLLVAFPAPILLALSLNYIRKMMFKKTVQMVTYAPYFISLVVMTGIILQLLSPNTGVIYKLVEIILGRPINFMMEPDYFIPIYVLSGIWQNIGWSSIIYLAALSGIDPTLHEAAVMDGANKVQRVRHIDIPGIMPTVVILFIMEVGRFMNVGFLKILLLQNPLNLSASEVIDTYVYRTGILSGLPDFSYAAAIGLFKSLIGLVLIVIANQIARKVNGSGVW
ncbi:MAG: binding-protein-dependent transport system inner rane component [Paenibacillus sp.]|nr:binding-protein-dependent transport system inner rane component [Paenibacillus sp.]